MAPSTADLFINALYCRIITLSYHLVSALKHLNLPESWTALTLKALRFRLLAIPAFVVRHARTRWLRVSRAHPFLPMLCKLLP